MHMLGMQLVKERVLRRHYGVEVTEVFQEGHHLEKFKYQAEDGWRCSRILRWFGNKGALNTQRANSRDRTCPMVTS